MFQNESRRKRPRKVPSWRNVDERRRRSAGEDILPGAEAAASESDEPSTTTEPEPPAASPTPVTQQPTKVNPPSASLIHEVTPAPDQKKTGSAQDQKPWYAVGNGSQAEPLESGRATPRQKFKAPDGMVLGSSDHPSAATGSFKPNSAAVTVTRDKRRGCCAIC